MLQGAWRGSFDIVSVYYDALLTRVFHDIRSIFLPTERSRLPETQVLFLTGERGRADGSFRRHALLYHVPAPKPALLVGSSVGEGEAALVSDSLRVSYFLAFTRPVLFSTPTGVRAFRLSGLWPEPCIRLFPISAPNILPRKGPGGYVVRSSV